ncbi:hypothetical protein [Mesorhizobium sp.]|uniref:hypothetical protein n=1 Tax=Mesorhizobium sp. TaxID=1871066 RepID=UPI000FE45DCE|nr:hypothetical protein [Mesorhizobium sp.]RWI35403.1 MAG: hypothetical protein EOR14_28275 [Mesorhizobium sp.]RWJ66428.1 MAG: hypothetical protein EOR34_28860 [Mesorhizobium sp.]
MNAHTPLPSIIKLPAYIGLCGNPKSGKSEAQKILHELYGYEPVDDGHVLREFAVNKLGLSWDDVQTQAGKARYTEILGKNWQNRDILGTLGKQLEDMFGEQIMPFIATRGLDPAKRYSFGSVRKTQGHFFKEAGGVVIQIMNPIAPPSPYAFDNFDYKAVDYTIHNDGLARHLPVEEARADLKAKIVGVMSQIADVRL